MVIGKLTDLDLSPPCVSDGGISSAVVSAVGVAPAPVCVSHPSSFSRCRGHKSNLPRNAHEGELGTSVSGRK